MNHFEMEMHMHQRHAEALRLAEQGRLVKMSLAQNGANPHGPSMVQRIVAYVQAHWPRPFPAPVAQPTQQAHCH